MSTKLATNPGSYEPVTHPLFDDPNTIVMYAIDDANERLVHAVIEGLRKADVKHRAGGSHHAVFSAPPGIWALLPDSVGVLLPFDKSNRDTRRAAVWNYLRDKTGKNICLIHDDSTYAKHAIAAVKHSHRAYGSAFFFNVKKESYYVETISTDGADSSAQ